MSSPTTLAALPAALGRPHFIGVGGSGMSAIAKLLVGRGARVSGSDAYDSATLPALRALGAGVSAGHGADRLPSDASCVVVSSAIAPDNPELVRAGDLGVPVLHRSQALAALIAGSRTVAVAGTHGKTTTSSMLAVALTAMGADPSYAIGADLDAPCSNARRGDSDLFVVEADESDRSFHAYRPEVAVVLNVEFEHHANYASLEAVHESFETFVAGVEPGGTLIVSADDPGARELTRRLGAHRPARVVTYGEAEDADVRIRSIARRGGLSQVRVTLGPRTLLFTVPVPGRHYAHNAVAALAAGHALGLDVVRLADALGSYTGARRRLEPKGTAAGVTVVDTYAHHPTEMRADLEALREMYGERRLLVVYQPHLFSRTRHLGAAMGRALALADASLVLDVYPAREEPLPGVTSALVVDAAVEAGAHVRAVHDMAAAPGLLAGAARPGDVLVTMGGGDVTLLGPLILDELRGTASPAGTG
ncbi:UDP-N-acetylmuramate--L-alanine ligase [Streptomyces sp. NPDC001941]|uniref:UDP-N-acetylmuramate--L-alanine ligase n=1 Tax=Streptomyces sp. NPDC001941 TaxID=3154659 RepID=UPI003321252F